MTRTLPSEAAGVTFRVWRRGRGVSQGPIQLNFFAILLRNRRNVAIGRPSGLPEYGFKEE
jgi:hypothetical protein